MIDCIVTGLSGLAAGIAIGAGPVLSYRASYRSAQADADLQRERLAVVLVDREAARFSAGVWRCRALSREWDALGCPALASGRPDLRLVVSNERRA